MNRPRILISSFASTEAQRDPHHLDIGLPIIHIVDLRHAHAPPRHLCAGYTGRSKTLRRAVFRAPEAQEMYVEALMLIQEYGHGRRRGGVTVGATCGSGTYRSVSMAEGLAREVETWGWEVVVMHLDIRGRPGERPTRLER